jgi:PPOX class probable F420-dependent enzyme
MAESALTVLGRKGVREFLVRARIARLSTANGSGVPHVIPICFWFDGTRFYFVIDEKPKRASGMALRRMRNIAENPRVAVLIDHYEEQWAHLAYVLVHGQARVVDDPEEYMLALRNLRDKYAQYRVMTLSPEKNPMVRIEVDRVHAWGERFNPPISPDESR